MERSSPQPTAPIKLYRVRLSGHCHRVELFLSLLGLPFALIEVDLTKGEQKSRRFLTLNEFGQVPVIVDGDVTMADSNAILVYLAMRYGSEHWYPRSPLAVGQVQRWFSIAAGRLAFGAAAARGIQLFRRPDDPKPYVDRAVDLLTTMDRVLERHPFLMGEEPTLADISMYSYTAAAEEGLVPLAQFPRVGSWLRKLEELPGFVMMPASAIGLRS